MMDHEQPQPSTSGLTFDQELDILLNQDIPLYGFDMERLAPDTLSISTMTLFFKSKKSLKIDLQDLSDKITSLSGNLLAHMSPDVGQFEAITIKIPARRRIARGTFETKKNFVNSFILSYHLNSTKKTKGGVVTVKVFSNGSFHTTGSKTQKDACKAVDRIGTFLNWITKQEIYTPGDYNIDVQLINTNFNLGAHIHIALLENYLQKQNLSYIYDKENHPGLRMKTANGITAILFKTGSVILTGAKKLSEVMDAYKYILSLLDVCITTIQNTDVPTVPVVAEKKRRGRKKKTEIQDVYQGISL